MTILVLGGHGYLGWPTELHLSEASHQVTSLSMAAFWDLEDTTDTTDMELDSVSPSGQINVESVFETYPDLVTGSEWQSRHTVLRENIAFPARAMCQVASLPTVPGFLPPTVPGFLPAKIEKPQRDWPHRYDAADHPAQLSRFQEHAAGRERLTTR
jgi:hypothetical protein